MNKRLDRTLEFISERVPLKVCKKCWFPCVGWLGGETCCPRCLYDGGHIKDTRYIPDARSWSVLKNWAPKYALVVIDEEEM